MIVKVVMFKIATEIQWELQINQSLTYPYRIQRRYCRADMKVELRQLSLMIKFRVSRM